MLEMAACGAKVLMLRCVEYARRYRRSDSCPFVVLRQARHDRHRIMEDTPMEDAMMTGLPRPATRSKVTVVGVPDVPGYAARSFAPSPTPT